MNKKLMIAGLLLSVAIGATMVGCDNNDPVDDSGKTPPDETVKTYTDYDWDNMDFSDKTVKYQLTGEYMLYQGHNYEFLLDVYNDGVLRIIQNNTATDNTMFDAYYYGTWSEAIDSELELTEVTLTIGYPGSGEDGALLLRENKFYAGGSKLSLTGFRFELPGNMAIREDASLNGTSEIKYTESGWTEYVAARRAENNSGDQTEKNNIFLTFTNESDASIVFDLDGKITAKSSTIEENGTWNIDEEGNLSATINNGECAVTRENGKFCINWNGTAFTCKEKNVSNTFTGSSTFEYGTLNVSEYLFTDGTVLFKSYAMNTIVSLKVGTYSVENKILTLKLDGEDEMTVNTNENNCWEYKITVIFSEYLSLDVTLTSAKQVEETTVSYVFTGKWNWYLDCTVTLYSDGMVKGVAKLGTTVGYTSMGTWETDGVSLKINMDGVSDVFAEGESLTFEWSFALSGNSGVAPMKKVA